jgi:type II secretory pathway component PulC
MKDNISPEERLLRLIKGERKQTEAPVHKKATEDSADLKTPPKSPIWGFVHIHPSYAQTQRLITVFIILSLIYSAISFIYPWFGLRKIKLPVIAKEGNTFMPGIGRGPEAKPYEFYLEGIKMRKIFDITSMPQAIAPASKADLDLIKDLSLVGIISGESSQAAIEDKRAQKTYYLTTGQFIGDLQIEDIQEGKVILNYKGQRMELYL